MVNNDILHSICDIFDFNDSKIINIFSLTDMNLSKHELTALFRKPGHKHYRFCKDQVLEEFLKGMQLKYRPEIQLKTL